MTLLHVKTMQIVSHYPGTLSSVSASMDTQEPIVKLSQVRINIQLLHAVMGSMAFCTPEGGNCTRGKAEGAIFPRGCTKPMDPNHSVQQLFCYTLVTLLFLFSKFCCNLKHFSGVFIV